MVRWEVFSPHTAAYKRGDSSIFTLITIKKGHGKIGILFNSFIRVKTRIFVGQVDAATGRQNKMKDGRNAQAER